MSNEAIHDGKRIKYGDMEAVIDQKLTGLILKLWKNGIRTTSCCEENQPGMVWIQFPDAEDARKFLHHCDAKLDWFQWDKDYCYSLDRNEEMIAPDGEGDISIRFPQDDLWHVVRCFPTATSGSTPK
jgi:hypothetical protein